MKVITAQSAHLQSGNIMWLPPTPAQSPRLRFKLRAVNRRRVAPPKATPSLHHTPRQRREDGSACG